MIVHNSYSQHNKGITLIEMIAVIVVVGLAIPPLMLMWQDLTYRSGRSEAMAQAGFYAQELMEEIKSKRFDENDNSPWSSIGTDTGENPSNKDTFDDVDDFHDYSDNPEIGYTRTVTVVYLDPNISDGGTWQVLGGGTSDFKQITVTVSHQFADASLVTLVSGY